MKDSYKFKPISYSLGFSIPTSMLRDDLLEYEKYVGLCVAVSV